MPRSVAFGLLCFAQKYKFRMRFGRMVVKKLEREIFSYFAVPLSGP